MPLRSMIVASALMVATLSIASADTYEPNTNRPGGDYNNFEVGTPSDCRTACLKDARCQAWTFVKPGIQGRRARCWMKDRVPPAVASGCCTALSKLKRSRGRFAIGVPVSR